MRCEIVRLAQLKDAQAIARVHVTVYRETYADFFPAHMLDAMSVDRRAKVWHEIIEKLADTNDAAVFVTEDVESAIVGFGSCSRQRCEQLMKKGFNGEFQAIYVLGSAQGHGLGRRLMAEMARYMSARSISGASCWVLRENTRARRFYEALAGQLVGDRVHQLGTPPIERVEVAYGWRQLDSLLG